MDQLQGVMNNFVLVAQALGAALLVSMICLVGFLVLTSFGNEHRMALARTAAFGLVIGFAILMLAPTVGIIVQHMFPVIKP